MSKIYSIVREISWQLGVICVLASIVLKILPTKLPVTPRGALVLAAVLFLCALATPEARKTPPSP